MRERALSFGAVAAVYERFRPGYPDELVRQMLAYAGRPVRTALEIGGHWQGHPCVRAPRRLRHGNRPDPAMLSELRRLVPDSVATREAAFEDLPLTPAYDLVFAAGSLHWTRPEDRWTRVAGMLAPGGTFASFAGQRGLADPDVRDRVEAVRSTCLDDDDVLSPDGTPAESPMQWHRGGSLHPVRRRAPAALPPVTHPGFVFVSVAQLAAALLSAALGVVVIRLVRCPRLVALT